jgi:hypothetical protein
MKILALATDPPVVSAILLRQVTLGLATHAIDRTRSRTQPSRGAEMAFVFPCSTTS